MARSPELALPTDSLRIQLQNKAAWNDARSRDLADFFTVGYMQRDIVTFLAVLVDAGVRTVLDVRHTPVSMYKPDFSKSNLQNHLAIAGIDYLHLPRFGVPNLHSFFNSGDHPVALLCMELDPTSCHRHRIAMKLESHRLRGFDL